MIWIVLRIGPPMNDLELNEPPDSRTWYYSIEIAPGVFTSGLDHPNLAITRNLLRAIAFGGLDCLDVGTQEAVVPILLKKGGAKRVVAYDRNDHSACIADLRKLYGVDFDYAAGKQLTELPGLLDAGRGRFFDLVVFSGVLYHMINPLGMLALVRGFCKVGGLFVFETAAFQDSSCHLQFNARGELGKASSYFVPTTTWMDYVLRMLGLRPIGVSYINGKSREAPLRVAVLCRSEAAPCPLDPEDDWVSARFHERVFGNESQVDWVSLKKTSSAIDCRPDVRAMSGSSYDAVRKSSPHTFRTEELRLSFASSM